MSETTEPAPTARRRLGRTLSRPRWTEYRALLEHALGRGYRIVSLEAWLRAGGDSEYEQPVLVLRHDVDQNPRSALRMLAIERDLGITSTWYFRWRTADRSVIEAARRHGGAVGLHYETLTRRMLSESVGVIEQRLVEICREELREEIAAFNQLFGPIRSICPHGDSRVPGGSNQVLLRGLDPVAFGVELDGNHGLWGRRLAYWLTDRSIPDGSWKDGADPIVLLDRRVSPLFCLTHPNNFSSGAALWADRLLAAALPAPRHGERVLVVRTGGDEPPKPRVDLPVPTPSRFAPIADRLQSRVAEHFAQRGTPLTGASGLDTLTTNSTLAEERTDTLLDVLFRHSGLTTIDGLRVLDAGCGLGAMALVLASRGATVVAFDPHADRMEVGAAVAREFDLPVSFRRGSMQKRARDAGAFDLVVANNSLCYVVRDSARRTALASLHSALRPGGWLVARNPNRLFPVDPFTRLPLVGMLEPHTADQVARRFGRRRSRVRLLAPWEARREVRAAGFEDVVVAGARDDGLRARLGAFARYHHVVARRPLGLSTPVAIESVGVAGSQPASGA